jgi:quinol monooxygenase YgiN
MFILKISGFIQDRERREFEQHFQQLLSLKPRKCKDFNLARDVSNPSLYHFYSLWHEKGTLTHYLASSEYKRLSGAFKTLGFIQNAFIGELSDSVEQFGISGGHEEDID